MALRAESSSFWPTNESSSFIAGLLDDEQQHGKQSDNVNKPASGGKGKGRAVDQEQEATATPTDLADPEEEEEFTYNPDLELANAQHESGLHDYEDQAFYGKIKFGEFAQYMANKRRKLTVQQGASRRNANEESKSELLKGLRIHVNGLTDPPAHVLQQLIVNNGGFYVQYLDARKTSATHIIASNLTPSKRIAFKEYIVVKAEWLLESIQDQKIKNWRLYREDSAPVKARDLGTAPAGTQIAQPRLSFGPYQSKQSLPITKKGSFAGEEQMKPLPQVPIVKKSTFVGVEVPVSKKKKLSPAIEAEATQEVAAPAKVEKAKEPSHQTARKPRTTVEVVVPVRRTPRPKTVSPPAQTAASETPQASVSIPVTSAPPTAKPNNTCAVSPPAPAAVSAVPAKRSRPATPVKPHLASNSAQVSPIGKASPRRLPPPTSDPLTELHGDGAAQAGHIVTGETSNAGGWYQTKPNARSAELLKSEEWRQRETAVSSKFLGKYYENSRLHMLSRSKAELKKVVDGLYEGSEMEMQVLKERKKRGPLKGTEEDGRVILHVDFDSFFVAASLLSREHLKGQPVVVCHASGGDEASSSEIASASYEARAFGIKNGMSLGSAKSLCKELRTVPYDFELYTSISAKLYQILFSYALELEAVSIDEAYITLPSVIPARTPAQLLEFAESLRAQIKEATGCYTSIGVSHNKLLARLATNRAKPSSSFQIGNGSREHPSTEAVATFLRDIDIESLPQIGWRRATEVETKLTELDGRLKRSAFAAKKAGPVAADEGPEGDAFSTVGQLLRFQKNQMKEVLGEKTGEMLYYYARGIDTRELDMEHTRKSVSAEVNYGIRFKADTEVEVFLDGLGAEVASRLLKLGYQGRQLTLKVMKRAEGAPIDPPKFMGHGVCDTLNASKTVELTNEPKLVGRVANDLMRTLAIPPKELRGIGLQMMKLEKVIGTSSAGAQAGQGVLLFKPKDKVVTAESAREVDGAAAVAEIAWKPQLPVKLPPKSPIVVPDMTSSPHFLDYAPPAADVSHTRPMRKRQPSANYIDLSSSDDEGVFMLSQAPASFKDKTRDQTHLAGNVIKRTLAAVPQKGQVIVIPATPAAPLLEPGDGLPNPASLTDSHLRELGLSAVYFKACSRLTQIALLDESRSKVELADLTTGLQNLFEKARKRLDKKQGKKAEKKAKLVGPFKEAAANAQRALDDARRKQAKENARAQGTVYVTLLRPTTSVPSFGGQSDLDAVREVLQEWMEGVGVDCGPELDDVDLFAQFCLKTTDTNAIRNGGRGADIAKVADVLRWWDHLIGAREKEELKTASQKSAALAWREAYRDVKSRVSAQVQERWGAPLA